MIEYIVIIGKKSQNSLRRIHSREHLVSCVAKLILTERPFDVLLLKTQEIFSIRIWKAFT